MLNILCTVLYTFALSFFLWFEVQFLAAAEAMQNDIVILLFQLYITFWRLLSVKIAVCWHMFFSPLLPSSGNLTSYSRCIQYWTLAALAKKRRKREHNTYYAYCTTFDTIAVNNLTVNLQSDNKMAWVEEKKMDNNNMKHGNKRGAKTCYHHNLSW